MKNYKFQMSLRGRGMTHAKLAAACGMNRSVLTRVLATKPGTRYDEGQGGAKERGKETRAKVVRYLTAKEIELLGWNGTGGTDGGGTMLHVEHVGKAEGEKRESGN